MSHIESVGIIGCGWLGTALAKALIAQQVNVFATTNSVNSSDLLIEQGITAQPLALPITESRAVALPEIDSEMAAQLACHPVFQQQQLVIAIPPQLKQGKSDYPEKIKQLVQAAEKSDVVTHIILITSSAIYNGLQGEVFEKSRLNFNAPKVQIMHDAEQAAMHFNQEVTILRLAGLVGPKRHPGRFLSSSTGKSITDAQAPVNLIHQADAVGLLLLTLKRTKQVKQAKQANQTMQAIQAKHGKVHEVFNGVSGTHVTKKVYYQHAAKALNLTAPQFIENQISNQKLSQSKVVNGDKARKTFQYEFVYDDLLAWL